MKQNIHTKLFNLQSEIGAISKDSKNPFYKSKYFDINSLIGQLKPLLDKYKLLLLQPITDNYVRSIIFDLDGGSIESSMKLPKNLDAQKIGSAITYYRRYTLQSLLALQAIDDDGNLASKPIINKQKINKPLLLDNSPELKNAIQGMSKGASLDDVKKIYRITPYIQEKLLNFKI
tara:strand:- start:2904 stop:3428 length:525 start_codon:yes stop_codon:yes gene_type:complete